MFWPNLMFALPVPLLATLVWTFVLLRGADRREKRALILSAAGQLLLLAAPALFAASVFTPEVTAAQEVFFRIASVAVLMLPLPLSFAGAALLLQLRSRRAVPTVLAALLAATVTALYLGALVG